MGTKISPTEVQNTVAVTHSEWTVTFQLHPVPAVVVTGRCPTLDEFRSACAYTWFALPVIDSLYIAAVYAFDKESV